MKTTGTIPLEHLRTALFPRADTPFLLYISNDIAYYILRVYVLNRTKRKEHCQNNADRMLFPYVDLSIKIQNICNPQKPSFSFIEQEFFEHLHCAK